MPTIKANNVLIIIPCLMAFLSLTVQYLCTVCGYVYDPEKNDNIPFNKLEDDWLCPLCAMPKEMFEKVED